MRSIGNSRKRAKLIEKGSKVSMRRQCRLWGIHPSSAYYEQRGETEKNLCIMKGIDRLHMEDPAAGSRRIRCYLRDQGFGDVSRSRVSRLMRLACVKAVYPRPRTSVPGRRMGIYPYLLKGLRIDRPNQLWSEDITYSPMDRGYMHLFVVMDWHSRRILSWELSNTLDTRFCLRALEKAVAEAGALPEIFNTDQESQFTSRAFLEVLISEGIRISMDGVGRWKDNVLIERFWRTIKYDDICLKSYENARELEKGIGAFTMRYNTRCPHQSLGNLTPEEVYRGKAGQVA